MEVPNRDLKRFSNINVQLNELGRMIGGLIRDCRKDLS